VEAGAALDFAVVSLAGSLVATLTGALLQPPLFMRMVLCTIAFVCIFQALYGFKQSVKKPDTFCASGAAHEYQSSIY